MFEDAKRKALVSIMAAGIVIVADFIWWNFRTKGIAALSLLSLATTSPIGGSPIKSTHKVC